MLSGIVVLVSGRGGLKGFFGEVEVINLEPTISKPRALGVLKHNKLLYFFHSSAPYLNIFMQRELIQK